MLNINEFKTVFETGIVFVNFFILIFGITSSIAFYFFHKKKESFISLTTAIIFFIFNLVLKTDFSFIFENTNNHFFVILIFFSIMCNVYLIKYIILKNYNKTINIKSEE